MYYVFIEYRKRVGRGDSETSWGLEGKTRKTAPMAASSTPRPGGIAGFYRGYGVESGFM